MTTQTVPAVFLDRDGVLSRAIVVNGKSYAPRQLSDFRLLPGAKESVSRLKQVGFMVIVVTNQPDVGNGLIDRALVEIMHEKLRKNTNVDSIYLCPHRQIEGCHCRKPKPSMLFEAAMRHVIDLPKSFLVGDRASDIEAGIRAGCATIFVNRHYTEPPPEGQICTVSSLPKAVDYILSNTPIGKFGENFRVQHKDIHLSN